MPLVSTRAVILHTFPYGETSKIARLVTRDHGVQSVIAKGARLPKSRYGGRLQVLSEGIAQFYFKPHRDLHTLSAFDVGVERHELARDVARYAAGAALAELIMRCSPAEPHPEIFDLVVRELDRIVSVPKGELEGTALGALWAVIAALGFAPRVDTCARDGGKLPAGRVTFSVADGGFLCAACARGMKMTALGPPDRAVLERLIAGLGDPIGAIPPRHAAAHKRLLVLFVERHVAEDRELRALTFWQSLS